MSFYLPIMINSRRLHVCHLQEKMVNCRQSYYWSFIIHAEKSQALFSVESPMPKLISQNGVHQELDGKWTFVVTHSDENAGDCDTYRIRLTKDEELKKAHDKACGLVVSGKMSDETHPIMVTADFTRLNSDNPIMVVLEYEKDGRLYEDGFKLYFCTDERTQSVSVALDFGSEASQARFTRVDGNVPLVGVFEQMLGMQNTGHDYWQGKPQDELFKSVFWVRHNPRQITRYGDSPKPVAEAPFISPLLAASENASVYDDMELLPNLKLVELSQGNNYITYGLKPITLKEGSDIDFGQANLADHVMRESVLRIILGNFLHAMLSEVNRNTSPKYLRLVVMAPNVYYQNKVFDMMRGLYLDFEIIRRSGKYPKCKGIEVQVVSESDAAFIGAKIYKRNTIVNASNGYFLNIDSGKGTTDFSILKQQPNFCKFSSLYRDGIPAAGNVITYAYYEALYDFMMAHDIDIQPFFENASKAVMINFMTYLEELKKQDVPNAEMQNFKVPKKQDIKNLTELVKYLENNKRRQIPCAMEYVDRKLQILIDCLKESISHYMKMNKCVFTQVILSGRALLYHPYKEKLIKMLIDQRWITSEASVVWIEGEQAKTCCLMGALAIEGECDVNYNSGLIGSPLLVRTEDVNEGVIARFFSRIFKRLTHARYSGVTMDFFYNGSAAMSSRNVTLRLGGRVHSIHSENVDEKKIYFLGSSFASQVGESGLRMIESNDLTFDNHVFRDLVNQSLFPYYEGSVGRPLNQFFMEVNKDKMLEQADKSVGKTTSVIRSERNTMDDADA